MSTSEYEFKLDWYGDVASALPRGLASQPPPANIFTDPWFTVSRSFELARLGDFSQIPNLIRLGLTTSDKKLANQSLVIAVSAGTSEHLLPVVDRVRQAEHTTDLWESGVGTLCLRQWLADVPLFLRLYELDPLHNEQNSLVYYFRDTLGIETTQSPYDLPIIIEEKYKSLREYYGTDTIALYQGKPHSVVRRARTMLQAAKRGHIMVRDRMRFEVSSGTDCSSFFAEGRGRPLAAAALIERFIEQDAARFADGQRYFWGHMIREQFYSTY